MTSVNKKYKSQQKTTNPIHPKSLIFLITLITLISLFPVTNLHSQTTSPCPEIKNERADKVYDKAIRAFRQRNYSETIRQLNDVIYIEPDYADAYFVLGLIYIKERRMNLKAAKENFINVIKLCPDYDIYAYYHLARITYGAQEYDKAYDYISIFLEDIDKIRTDEDYDEAVRIQDFAKFYEKMLKNPVPFNPKPVPGISTEYDEYLPIISPDNEMALFTRKIKIPPRKDDITPRMSFKERFMYSYRQDDEFNRGQIMPFPFNRHDNEGGATLTIDNRLLFYTLCKYTKDMRYYNCDICYSEFKNGVWTEIQSVGNNVNLSNAWDSQPSITSDGKTLYFVSDREGGYGGYDIYRTHKDNKDEWSIPVNLGTVINTRGNEKSPFIHTDSQTLYFSSDGLMGLGGYDIFYSKFKENGSWSEPENIGYPINSYDDDVGFFVSTDGHYGYFASNKFAGFGGWDLYSFDLYEEARPEKVLFVKGKINDENNTGYKNTHVELKNIESKGITKIPVDSVTGKYVAAVLFRNDYIMTVKRKGYVQESKYISRIDPRFTTPENLFVELKPIKVGKSYRLNDVYFDFNSYELKPESKILVEEFFLFLNENPTLKVSIQGHTDNIGNDNDNLVLSENRAKAVYEYLVSLGVDIKRVDYKGFGESKPIDTNTTKAGRALNRRTEFVIVKK
ncbi:MAG: OmpA family protein [Bacteroidales bacterium]|nr:OmpA family protein [Bacteroidales bacterium]